MPSDTFRRRHVLRLAAALALPAWVCRARACEYFAPTLRVSHPWTRATPQDAEFAVVAMRLDEVSETDRLIGAETPVAERIELAGPGVGPAVDLLIPQGRETLLGLPGPHLRLLGLRQPLELARSYPLTLVFERGGSVRATLNVDYQRFF